ncbi:helix-turn-helix domain-containing protein [Salisediminibacterium selenitireducens]|uniref:Transcriptional regulator, CdaR n=1 Tax=Bacillus selenitireducens (strain ATCC 700615 / DSM 15326 / MLS10) TaxID=439292 RepID=D6XZQ0_BACIE|nr:GAF domain-containing protein [Salisediminibacterium selenitireducens]ADH98424.1 transcriptional regulator, CdaR [[Bacillus] selenitireducens MLS10]
MSTERKLMSLINSSRVLNSTLDIDEVLHHLIQEVLNVIDGANASILFLYDKRHDHLYAKAAIGFDMHHLQHVRLKPGEGMSGYTFQMKSAQIFRSSNQTHAHMANIPDEAKAIYAKSLGRYKVPDSALSVPLMIKGACIGVLTVDIYEKPTAFDDENLRLLETFATQAAVAIENATMFSQNERTSKIHRELSRAALTRGGIGTIIQSLSGIVNLPVVLFNEFFDLLDGSDSAAIATARSLIEKKKTHLHQYISPDQIQSLFGQDGDQPIEAVFFPLNANDRTAGYVMILLSDHAFIDPVDQFAIEQTSMVFTMEILRKEKESINDWRHSSMMLDHILHGEWNHQVISNLENLPVFTNPNAGMVMVHLQLDISNVQFGQFQAKKDHVLRILARKVGTHRCQGFLLEETRSVTFLFMIPAHLDARNAYESIGTLFTDVAESLHASRSLSIKAGLSRLVTEVSGLRPAYQDAVKAVEYLFKLQTARSVLTYDELGIERLMLNTPFQEMDSFVTDTIGPIAAYDAAHDADLLLTLKTYLESTSNMALTAKKCFVHVNTVKYRLQLIKELTGIADLSGRKAFELQLGIYVHEHLENR